MIILKLFDKITCSRTASNAIANPDMLVLAYVVPWHCENSKLPPPVLCWTELSHIEAHTSTPRFQGLVTASKS